MRTKVRKWGNSLGLRIPKALAEEIAVHDHSEVELTVREEKLVITPVKRRAGPRSR